MTRENRQKEFLEKAEEAEEHAAASKFASDRDAWLKVANDYRRLAETT
jgi:hypothetical protein